MVLCMVFYTVVYGFPDKVLKKKKKEYNFQFSVTGLLHPKFGEEGEIKWGKFIRRDTFSRDGITMFSIFPWLHNFFSGWSVIFSLNQRTYYLQSTTKNTRPGLAARYNVAAGTERSVTNVPPFLGVNGRVRQSRAGEASQPRW